MNILLLHNNNVPFSFISENWDDDIDLKIEILKPSTDDNDYDVFVSQQLESIFFNNIFDLIILPYSFSEYNPIEYTGLNVAAHIRLTPEWNHSRKPILFVGPEEAKQVAKLSEMGSILFSPGICSTRTNSLPNLTKGIKELSLGDITDSDFDDFLNRIQIPRPSNYATHHSIANEWAVMRWGNDVINWGEQEKPVIGAKSFTSMLYFKYLIAKSGSRDRITKTWKRNHGATPIIDGISGKVIAYIDDEYDKGWSKLLSIIFENSGAKLHVYDKFKEHKEREDLISSINDFVDNVNADCYLLDLRLHDDDFEKEHWRNLTGHEVAKHIKNSNIGNQIVVFTASNKIWNLKEAIFKIGVSGYSMKESPELNLKRQESLGLYQEFANAIRQACKMSYLKEIVNKQSRLKSILPSITQLDNIVNLLSIDQGENDRYLLGAAMLSEMVFIEDFIKNQLGYELLSTGEGLTLKVSLCSKKAKYPYQQLVTGHIFFKRIQIGLHSIVIDVSEYNATPETAPSGMCDVTGSDISLVVAVLMIIFNLPRRVVKQYVDLKFIRNTQIAHPNDSHNDEKKLSAEQIVDFYHNVIYPIVLKSKQIY